MRGVVINPRTDVKVVVFDGCCENFIRLYYFIIFYLCIFRLFWALLRIWKRRRILNIDVRFLILDVRLIQFSIYSSI